jgi:hypothetical protein
MKHQAKPDRRGSGIEPGLRALLRRIAATCQYPEHVIELYYWSAEPELIGILRRYVALPDKARDALQAFLAMTADCPETVEVTVSQEGQVTLYSPVVAEVLRKTAILPVGGKSAQAGHSRLSTLKETGRG